MSVEVPVTVIEPSKGWIPLRLGALWRYRELLYFLIWRDVKVRYKQTLLGAAWAILQPLLTMVVFSIFFGKLARMPSDGVPYPLFAYVALVPWTFFANGLTLSSNSLVANQTLLRKVFFPRLVIPVSAVASGLLDFAIEPRIIQREGCAVRQVLSQRQIVGVVGTGLALHKRDGAQRPLLRRERHDDGAPQLKRGGRNR